MSSRWPGMGDRPYTNAGRITMPRTPTDCRISRSSEGSQPRYLGGAWKGAPSPRGAGPVSPKTSTLLVAINGQSAPSSVRLNRDGRRRANSFFSRVSGLGSSASITASALTIWPCTSASSTSPTTNSIPIFVRLCPPPRKRESAATEWPSANSRLAMAKPGEFLYSAPHTKTRISPFLVPEKVRPLQPQESALASSLRAGERHRSKPALAPGLALRPRWRRDNVNPGGEVIEVNLEELEALLERKREALGEEDYQKLKKGLRALSYLTERISDQDTTITQLRALLVKPSTEKTSKVLEQAGIKPPRQSNQQTILLQTRALREYDTRRDWRIVSQVKEIGSGAFQRQRREKLAEAA